MTKTPTHYLDISDFVTSTPHLYSQYLATKVARIPRLERYEAMMRNYPGDRPLSWAECLIKLVHYYGTKIKYIIMAAVGDIDKLSMIFQKKKLTFWCRVFNEYSLLLTKLDIDSSKNYLVQNRNRLQVDDG